jgi:hypothetical protein
VNMCLVTVYIWVNMCLVMRICAWCREYACGNTRHGVHFVLLYVLFDCVLAKKKTVPAEDRTRDLERGSLRT